MTAGVQTVIFPVRELDKAKALFNRLLDAEPILDQPYYVGYKVAGQEVDRGIDHRRLEHLGGRLVVPLRDSLAEVVLGHGRTLSDGRIAAVGGSASRHRARCRRRCELDGLLWSEAPRQGEREAGGEGVPGAVRVRKRSSERRRRPSPHPPVHDVPTTVGALGRDDEPRRRIEVAQLIPLGGITRAVNERVELNAG